MILYLLHIIYCNYCGLLKRRHVLAIFVDKPGVLFEPSDTMRVIHAKFQGVFEPSDVDMITMIWVRGPLRYDKITGSLQIFPD